MTPPSLINPHTSSTDRDATLFECLNNKTMLLARNEEKV